MRYLFLSILFCGLALSISHSCFAQDDSQVRQATHLEEAASESGFQIITGIRLSTRGIDTFVDVAMRDELGLDNQCCWSDS